MWSCLFHYSSLNDFCFPRPGMSLRVSLKQSRLSTASQCKGFLLRASSMIPCVLKLCLVCLNLHLALPPLFHWTPCGSVGGRNWPVPAHIFASKGFSFCLLRHTSHFQEVIFLWHFLRSVRVGLLPLRSSALPSASFHFLPGDLSWF